MKFVWVFAALFAIVGTASVFINKNANSDLRPYLGKWTGGFEVQRVGGEAKPELARRNSLSGFLQVYGAKKKYEMRLSGEQQEIVVTGTWSLENPNRISLRAGNIAIEDFGGSEKRDPNLAYIPNEAVRAAYQKPLTLDLSENKQGLKGLLISVGDLAGEHSFDRVGSGR